ncbi:MAG: transposase [Chloracidobacterium sp.]|nr:transposase [Chloracidobacterium sp.]
MLDRLANRGLPQRIRFDNGPVPSVAVADWASRGRARVHQPGRPMQNGYVERFNRTYRQGSSYVSLKVWTRSELTAKWIDFSAARCSGSMPPRASCGHVLLNPKTPI